MKHSLRIKVTLLLTILLAFTIFLCWFLNQTFLEDYYQRDKINSLSESYDELNSLLGKKKLNVLNENNNDSLSDIEEEKEDADDINGKSDTEQDDTVNLTAEESEIMINSIEKLEVSANINFYILTEYYDFLFNSFNLYFQYPTTEMLKYTKTMKYDRVKNSVKIYMFGNFRGSGLENPELLKSSNESVNIYKIYDNESDSFYIDLFGYLDNGCVVMIRTNFESIKESAKISSRFLRITGIIVTIIGSLFMFIFSRSFTKPIKELSNIAKKMSRLDFDAKYTHKNNDEIGELGTSINELSEKLETTITELKSVNIELQTDIARKTEIDEMRKDFLSNVSHELKTPLALIQGYAEGLQENINDDEESREFYCDVIIDEAHKMNNMVKKILSLNQIEFGSNQIDLERFDITKLVLSIVDSSDILIKQKEVNLIFHEHSPIYVWADQFLIEEVVTNYLSNALNHIDGNKVIDINFTATEKTVRVSVFNTGKKIPVDELENIWVKFYKVDKARTREYGGSGIGLSIVKAIMASHNQSCGVINHEAGVEFWFELDISIDEK